MRSAGQALVTLALSLCMGCAVAQQRVRIPDLSKPIEDPTKARIYVIRPASAALAGSAMLIYDGDTRIGQTGAQSYLCWERPPGESLISVKAENEFRLPLKVEAGRVYYVLQRVHWGVFQARSTLAPIEQEKALQLLRTCKLARVN